MSKFKTRYRSDAAFYLYYSFKNMRARVNGKTAGDGKSKLWLGLPICVREDFIDWSLSNPDFLRLFQEWGDNGYSHRGPTVHRIDRDGGYTLGNMRWVSHAEKSRLHLEQGKKTREAKKLKM